MTPGFLASAIVLIVVLFSEMRKFGVEQIGQLGIRLFWPYSVKKMPVSH